MKEKNRQKERKTVSARLEKMREEKGNEWGKKNKTRKRREGGQERK